MWNDFLNCTNDSKSFYIICTSENYFFLYPRLNYFVDVQVNKLLGFLPVLKLKQHV